MMIVRNLFPGDVLQFYDLLQNGYWHARSASFGHGPLMHMGSNGRGFLAILSSSQLVSRS
jgi:hypothetical protein